MYGFQIKLLFVSFLSFLLAVCPLHATNKNKDKSVHVSRIVVYKSERKMLLLDSTQKVLKTYQISLGANPEGHKIQEGDERTPEGHYKILSKNSNSQFYKSLKISYPNQKDFEAARKKGVSPGGNIMIHGLANGLGWVGFLHRYYSRWTDGCIGVTNAEIEEIWDIVPVGTAIEIKP